MLRQHILNDISLIQRPDILNQVFEYMQLLNKADSSSNIADVLSFSGSITNDNAEELLSIIRHEFNTIEGEW